MARSKIPVVDNSLTPDEQEFIAGGASDNKASNGVPEKKEKTIALNMEVPVRLKERNESLQRIRRIQADWRSTRSGVGIL